MSLEDKKRQNGTTAISRTLRRAEDREKRGDAGKEGPPKDSTVSSLVRSESSGET